MIKIIDIHTRGEILFILFLIIYFGQPYLTLFIVLIGAVLRLYDETCLLLQHSSIVQNI